uniref:RRM domain-containing protein n=1 Tax=Hemiselmis tepida TaxID=464990 RepID=A0A7S0W0C0_9CRYP
MSRQDKRTLYVGGLAEDVDVATLRAAFIPFGELVDANIPLDNKEGTHRGFGFVEFESPEDASEAIYNMNNGELNGRVLSVNIAKPMTVSERSQKAIWHAEADSFFEKAGWTEEVVQDDGVEDEGMQPKAT